MIRSLWIAKTGLDAQQTNLDVISNNLANVSTNGFKRARAVFEDLLYQTMRQPGAQSSQQTQIPSGLMIGTGVRPISTERIYTQGSLQRTEGPLDIAVNGNGFLQIQMPDGTLAYTRDGAFQLDSTGQVVTSSGYPLSPTITIPSNAVAISISRDGIVSYSQQGVATPTQVGTIQLASFVNQRRPAEHGRKPVHRDRRLRYADTQHPGHQRHRPAQPGLCRDVERQRGRGAGDHDPDPARL
jgi:flagellar basal-body rod protein FlgG